MTPRWDHFEKNLDRACRLVDYHARSGTRLYVFSEFFLTGSPAGSSADVYRALCITIPGPELDQLAAVARRRRVFIAGMAYEKEEDAWPGRFFNTAFILSPDGEVILKYRKHYDQTCKTKPGDVFDDYVDRLGPDRLHPVVETEIGTLGAMVCFDVNFWENARSLALKGAEILLHPTSEPRSYYHLQEVGGWEMARQVRAWENVCYWVSANQAWYQGSDRAEDTSHGHSQVIDYRGRVLNIADGSGESIISAEVDLDALRKARARVEGNWLVQAQAQVYAATLKRRSLWPANLHREAPPESGRVNNLAGVEVVKELTAAGVFVAPLREPVVNLNRPG